MREFTGIDIHASEYPAAWRAGLVDHLRRGRLPGKFLYHSPAQAQRWLDYHRGFSPSRGDEGLRALYGSAHRAAIGAATVAAEDGGGADGQEPAPFRYVSLGCGGGNKDGDFIAQWMALGRDGAGLRYLPLDASPSLVLEATHHVEGRHPGVSISPLVADLSAEPGLRPWIDGDAERGAGVVSCFGMMPNMDASRFPAYLAGLLTPGEFLLLSANLSPGGMAADRDWIVPQYDNDLARAWYGGALRELGIPVEAFELVIEPRRMGGVGNTWRVVVQAHFHAAHRLELFGEEIEFTPGRPLEVFHSNRFTATELEARMAAAGLEPLNRWVMESGEEGIWLFRRGGET